MDANATQTMPVLPQFVEVIPESAQNSQTSSFDSQNKTVKTSEQKVKEVECHCDACRYERAILMTDEEAVDAYDSMDPDYAYGNDYSNYGNDYGDYIKCLKKAELPETEEEILDYYDGTNYYEEPDDKLCSHCGDRYREGDDHLCAQKWKAHLKEVKRQAQRNKNVFSHLW